MRFYKTSQKIKLLAGVVLALSADQVRRRKHLLMIDDGTITTRAPVEFKAGEIIGFEQKPRALLSMLEPVEFDDIGGDEMFGIGNVDDIIDPEQQPLIAAGPDIGGDSVGADSSAQTSTVVVDGEMISETVVTDDGINQLQTIVAANLDIDPSIVAVIGERPDNADPGEQIQTDSADFAPVPEAKPAKKPGK